MPPKNKVQAPQDRGALASGLPPVRELSEKDRRHAQAIVAEFVLGHRGSPASVTPVQDGREILGALGLLPDQPKIQSSDEVRRVKGNAALRASYAATKAGRPKTDARARSRVQQLSAVRLDGENTGQVDAVAG